MNYKICLADQLSLSNPYQRDLLLIPSTAADTYLLQLHYSKIAKLPIVFVEDRKDYLAVRRESYEDLSLNNLEYRRD